MADKQVDLGNRLSLDITGMTWEAWKRRAEDTRLPELLSDTAIMLLYLALGGNAWRLL